MTGPLLRGMLFLVTEVDGRSDFLRIEERGSATTPDGGAALGDRRCFLVKVTRRTGESGGPGMMLAAAAS